MHAGISRKERRGSDLACCNVRISLLDVEQPHGDHVVGLFAWPTAMCTARDSSLATGSERGQLLHDASRCPAPGVASPGEPVRKVHGTRSTHGGVVLPERRRTMRLICEKWSLYSAARAFMLRLREATAATIASSRCCRASMAPSARLHRVRSAPFTGFVQHLKQTNCETS
jgi:hypothetical protein